MVAVHYKAGCSSLDGFDLNLVDEPHLVVGIPYRTGVLKQGLTKTRYAFSLSSIELILRFRLRKPSLLAFALMSSMWLSQLLVVVLLYSDAKILC